MDFLSNDLEQYITEDKVKIPFQRSFASYEGKTKTDKLKKDCWIIGKNDGLTPRDVFLTTNKKFTFQCDCCPHIFTSTLNSITRKEGVWCPYCSTQSMCSTPDCEHCFKKSFAAYKGKTPSGNLKIDYWMKDKNKGLTPRDITKSSDKKFWFQCDNCPHSFQSDPGHMKRNGARWCPYCSIPCKKICTDKNCEHCYKKSFASYEGKTINGKLKRKCWIIEKNNGLTPRDIIKGCNKKFWFQCDECPHIFNICIGGITSSKRWCPYCCIPSKKMCPDKNCDHCYKKSFASYNGITTTGKLKKDCWITESNGGLKPRDVTLSTAQKFWFKCDSCPHSFNLKLDGIKRTNTWCPYCSIPSKKMCPDKNCDHCYKKSFASYEGKTINGKLKKDCWIIEKNNGLTPRDILRGHDSKKWFQCDICDKLFDSRIYNITGNNPTWCPHCVNKTEQMFQSWFKDNYEYKLESQKRFKWCKNTETNRILPFDFCIPDLKIIIEIDGDQHFRQVWNWKAPELQQGRDVYKMNLALEKGYTIIRIYQPDIYSNKNNWDKETEEAIKLYDEPQIICIGRKKLN